MKLELSVLLLVLPAAAAAQSSPPLVSERSDLPEVTYTDDRKILLGRPAREVTPVELYQAIGRDDLVARSKANARRRVPLFISAGAVAVVGVVTGAVVLAAGPDLSRGPCQVDLAYHNTYCVPTHRIHQAIGGAAIALGLAGGGLLASIGLWSRPQVLSGFEIHKLIEEHNARRLTPVSVKLSPVMGPGFAGLAASGTF